MSLRHAFVAALTLGAASAASACPACYGAGDNTPVTTGMTYAVGGMLLLTVAMLGLIAYLARAFQRRARALAAEAGSAVPTPLSP